MLRLASGGIQQRLWFDIQRVLAELQRICVEARAVELLNQRRVAEASGFEELLERVSMAPEAAVDTRFVEADALSQGPAFVAKYPPGSSVDIVAIRAKLRKQLSWLKGRLAEELTEREVYNSLFPIVIYTDELINVATDGASTHWEPLQGELYDVDNGGEVFFSTIDALLHKDDTHPIIYEIYFFCLHDGFVGQYHGQPGRIHDYCRRLAEHIPVRRPEGDDLAERPAGRVALLAFPYHVYAVSALIVVALWIGLGMFARHEIEQESHRARMSASGGKGQAGRSNGQGGGARGGLGEADPENDRGAEVPVPLPSSVR